MFNKRARLSRITVTQFACNRVPGRIARDQYWNQLLFALGPAEMTGLASLTNRGVSTTVIGASAVHIYYTQSA